VTVSSLFFLRLSCYLMSLSFTTWHIVSILWLINILLRYLSLLLQQNFLQVWMQECCVQEFFIVYFWKYFFQFFSSSFYNKTRNLLNKHCLQFLMNFFIKVSTVACTSPFLDLIFLKFLLRYLLSSFSFLIYYIVIIFLSVQIYEFKNNYSS
jgi:hypothetical protein